MHRFEGSIHAADGGGAYIPVPAAILDALGGGGRIPVQVTFDGIPYTGSIMSMGDGPCLGVLKSLRADLGKGPGDTVAVTVERDTAERTVEVPGDLAAALADAEVRGAFDALSYSRRREHIKAVSEAKRPETRARRIAKTVEGVRRGRV